MHRRAEIATTSETAQSISPLTLPAPKSTKEASEAGPQRRRRSMRWAAATAGGVVALLVAIDKPPDDDARGRRHGVWPRSLNRQPTAQGPVADALSAGDEATGWWYRCLRSK